MSGPGNQGSLDTTRAPEEIVVPPPLLETKLFVPRSRRSLVQRPRLRERLDRGTAAKLMLVSAPAGFGKTTVLTQWLAEGQTDGWATAWLSLDRGDNDPTSFWTYLIAALRTVEPSVGGSALALLQGRQPPPVETVLTTLLNDLGSGDDLVSVNDLVSGARDIVLVLDDYHVIDARDVQEGMAFLLEHLPRRLHLVIASRADPALPLARLRARGELVETRAADLRFTPDEAATYLNETMGLQLTAGDVAALERRTEGWIAALQLAALSMQGRDDVAGFIAGFAGDDRYVVDYLAEEVLQRQSVRIQAFLLQTSILGRLSGPLCDAVTEQGGGKAMLEALERGNLFLVPLDDRRRWYRYHHLFADVLHARLLDEQPDDVPELHRRASVWYEQQGEPTAAIEHALAAEDFERTADLVELALPALRRSRQEATIRGWLESIPGEVVRLRPVLAMGLIGALMASGEFDGIEGRLLEVEQWVEQGRDPAGPGTPSEAMVVVDTGELPRLAGAIELSRAGLALVGGDVPATIRHARLAIERAAAGDVVTRSGASALAGLAYWGGGDLEAAHQGYSVCVDGLQRAGHISDVLGCSITLGDIRITQGRLGEALHTYEHALRLASDQPGPVLRGTADMYVAMSRVAYERDDVPTATQHLLHARELGEHTWLPQNPYRWRVAMARVQQAAGDFAGALGLLDEAQQVYAGDFSPNVRPVLAMRARVRVAQGEATEAMGWAREQGLSVDDDLSYLREFEHVTLARLLLARSQAEHAERCGQEATRLLERLLRAAEAGERTGSVIEILTLQALARHARGDVRAATASLHHALTLAEPEGYVRVFVDEGPAMTALLRIAARRGIASTYVRRLLAAADPVEGGSPAAPGLVEPLSGRELDVLRMLRSDLGGPDIARELIVSLNTVRTHTKSIYAKLGVNNRRAAVSRAEELDLFSSRRDRRT